MGRIHAGKTVKPGGRYDRILKFLRIRGAAGATGLEIEKNCRLRAGATAVSELRSMGYRIDSEDQGVTQLDGRVWRYWLRSEPSAAPAPQPQAPPGEIFARTG